MRRQVLAAFLQGHPTMVPGKCIEESSSGYTEYFGSLEMHPKRRYKICTCSFILKELEVFRVKGIV